MHISKRARIIATSIIGIAALTGMALFAFAFHNGGAAHAATSNGFVYTANPPSHFAAASMPAAGFIPSQCEATYGLACYTPAYIRSAYNVPSNLDGTGQTIVIVDAYGSPTIQSDLHTFDQEFGLPDPTLNIIYPGGSPTFNPLQNHAEADWAGETSLDVEWSHAIAPGATIDLVIAANNGGDVLDNAVQYAVANHLGNVLSMSYGAPEAAINGNSDQEAQANATFQQAAAQGMSVFASSGDNGAENGLGTANSLYPASDPNVTSVGGTDLFISDKGAYQSETVWNDTIPSLCPFGCAYGVFGATGGAPSSLFAAPSYQSNTGYNVRTSSDVGYNASVYTAILAYQSFPSEAAGFYFYGGTSEGAPQWAAIAALADQAAASTGNPTVGPLNPQVYAIAANAKQYAADFHDVTVGNNGMSGHGFNAGPGYDIPTGVGSPNVTNLINTLVPHAKAR